MHATRADRRSARRCARARRSRRAARWRRSDRSRRSDRRRRVGCTPGDRSRRADAAAPRCARRSAYGFVAISAATGHSRRGLRVEHDGAGLGLRQLAPVAWIREKGERLRGPRAPASRRASTRTSGSPCSSQPKRTASSPREAVLTSAVRCDGPDVLAHCLRLRGGGVAGFGVARLRRGAAAWPWSEPAARSAPAR